jgi:hypothetical protein
MAKKDKTEAQDHDGFDEFEADDEPEIVEDESDTFVNLPSKECPPDELEKLLKSEFTYVLMTVTDFESHVAAKVRAKYKNFPVKFVDTIRVSRITNRTNVVLWCPGDIDQVPYFHRPIHGKEFWMAKRNDGEIDVGKFINALARVALPYTIQHKTNPIDSFDLGSIKLATC